MDDTYDTECTYDCTIDEVAGSEEGMTYDRNVAKATVTVTKNENDQLVASVTRGDNNVSSSAFTNVYIPDSVADFDTAEHGVAKRVSGSCTGNEEFVFKLAKADDAEGDELPKETTVSVKRNQTGIFDEIIYIKAGTYLYTITEVESEKKTANMTYDTTPRSTPRWWCRRTAASLRLPP